jgi:hypothetical protein
VSTLVPTQTLQPLKEASSSFGCIFPQPVSAVPLVFATSIGFSR